MEPLRNFVRSGNPTWGTCAGLILLARDVGRDQPILGLMDIAVKRNAFGRQVDSFTTPLQITGIDEPYPGVFIRAPLVASAGDEVAVLATLPHPPAPPIIVAARQANMLATSFHPELTRDTRVHEYFLHMVKQAAPIKAVPSWSPS